MSERLTYEAALRQDENGDVIVRFPDFDMITFGENREDAIDMAYDLLEGRAEILIGMGKPLPKAKFGHALEDGEVPVIFTTVFDRLAAAENWSWISTQDAAEILGVTVGRVRVMAKDGVLPSKREGRNVYVSREAVDARKKAGARRGRPSLKETMCVTKHYQSHGTQNAQHA